MRLATFRQTLDSYPFLTEHRLRWWVRTGDDTGFHRVIVRPTRRLLFDLDALEAWLEERREGGGHGVAP